MIQGLSLETFEVSTEALGLLSPMTAEFPIPSREINRGGQPTRNFSGYGGPEGLPQQSVV